MSAFVFIICIEPDGRDHAHDHGPKGRPTGFMAPFRDEKFSFLALKPTPSASLSLSVFNSQLIWDLASALRPVN